MTSLLCEMLSPPSVIPHRLPDDIWRQSCQEESERHIGAPPTPPHSPSSSAELDDLVATIPEILESPSRVVDVSDILSELEATVLYDDTSNICSSISATWGRPMLVPTPDPKEALQNKDIMWGSGTPDCCMPRKPRHYSLSSEEELPRDVSDDDIHLPETPSGTDSDEEVSAPLSCKRKLMDNEHDYSRPFSKRKNSTSSTIGPSDTEDEVDVVTCNDSPILPLSDINRSHNRVKRQLQVTIEGRSLNSKLFVTRVPTHGKPASYTKRMRDLHSEVIRGSKCVKRSRPDKDVAGKRSVHNSMERQRRVDLRNAFETLRYLVPVTREQEKAPKVQILRKAAEYCCEVQCMHDALAREKQKLEEKQRHLRQRLRLLELTLS